MYKTKPECVNGQFPINEVELAVCTELCQRYSTKTLECDGDWDLVECKGCNRQWIAPCNFDEECK